MSKTIILASNSPRRRDILRQIGVEFESRPAHADESARPGEGPEEYAMRTALDKARAAAGVAGSGIVVAADTIVALENDILGKPVDGKDAERMLTMLSGKAHRVITGLAVMDAAAGKYSVRSETTTVWFRSLTPEEISSYAATGEPMDKAGAYGIQERGALLVEKINGCYYNVVGLPIALLCEMLRDFGIEIL